MVLRVSGTGDGPGDAFDVEVAGLQGQCYVDIWGETRSYRGELGLRRADGSLDALAPPALVQLPSAGPAGQAPNVPAETPAAAAPPAEVARSANVAAAPAAPTMPAAPPPLSAAHELPEPVRHPFPLPPAEGSDYDPLALIGGFVPLDAPVPDIPAEAGAGPEDQPLAAADDAQPPAADAGGDATAAAAVDPASLLPLENVLTLSSFALGRDSVEFEINAELHVFGRARPGTRLQLFGQPVPLRPDGSFSITRPLPAGALVFSSLLVADDGEVSE